MANKKEINSSIKELFKQWKESPYNSIKDRKVVDIDTEYGEAKFLKVKRSFANCYFFKDLAGYIQNKLGLDIEQPYELISFSCWLLGVENKDLSQIYSRFVEKASADDNKQVVDKSVDKWFTMIKENKKDSSQSAVLEGIDESKVIADDIKEELKSKVKTEMFGTLDF